MAEFKNIISYCYGYWGGEKDNEFAGPGNFVDLGDRHQDTRTGRLGWSTDRLFKNFPWQSPYVSAGNNPIKFIDEKGQFQVDPGIAKDYPMIYKYLSTQIEKDVLNNTKITGAYKAINPDVTDANLKTIFTNGSGPVLYNTSAPGPGSWEEAAGHLTYTQGTSSMEINTKIFDRVEKVLRESNSPQERMKAMMFLFQEVTHEASHEVMGYKNNIKVSEYQQRERSGSFSYGEDGEKFEQAVWGTPEDPDKSKAKYIDGVSPDNAKNSNENLEKSTKQGANPTVPAKQ